MSTAAWLVLLTMLLTVPWLSIAAGAGGVLAMFLVVIAFISGLAVGVLASEER